MTFNFLFTRRFQPCVIHQGSGQHHPGLCATHNNQPVHERRWQKWAPRVPLKSQSRVPMHRIDRGQPPSEQICLGVGLIGCMPLKMLLCSSNDAPLGAALKNFPTRKQKNTFWFHIRKQNRASGPSHMPFSPHCIICQFPTTPPCPKSTHAILLSPH